MGHHEIHGRSLGSMFLMEHAMDMPWIPWYKVSEYPVGYTMVCIIP